MRKAGLIFRSHGAYPESSGLAWGALLLALTHGAWITGCGATGDTFVLIGGEKIDTALVDRDPIALLPSGVILMGYLDALAMFRSTWGTDVAKVITSLLPLGPESNFSPERDVTRIYSGLYSMQGADFCAVIQGSFDANAIRRAADARAITIAGAPLVKTRYADNDIYTAGNIGFVVLTAHTALTGNETGIRRALDRLRLGKRQRSVPAWMVDHILTKGADMAFAGDLSSQAIVNVAAQRYALLGDLRTVRGVGTFRPPGLNFAGTLTYGSAQTASSAAASLNNVQQTAQMGGLFSSLGLGTALPSIQVAQHENDVAFTVPVDESFVQLLLRLAVDATRTLATASPTQ
jgi:hypothetical protein